MAKTRAEDAIALEKLRNEAAGCKACHLWRHATQTVFGQGAPGAPLMLVGEQPGDKEDLDGHPFVGPAGKVLDRALAESGIERKKTYVTNAVKHFKFVRRGKIRLHQKPDASEIDICNRWLTQERQVIRPRLIVAMGATAVRGVFGKPLPIGKNRRHLFALEAEVKGLITVHPSYILRLKDEDKDLEYARFVDDLKLAAKVVRDLSERT